MIKVMGPVGFWCLLKITVSKHCRVSGVLLLLCLKSRFVQSEYLRVIASIECAIVPELLGKLGHSISLGRHWSVTRHLCGGTECITSASVVHTTTTQQTNATTRIS
jgi:hypothetical protein